MFKADENIKYIRWKIILERGKQYRHKIIEKEKLDKFDYIEIKKDKITHWEIFCNKYARERLLSLYRDKRAL